MLHPNNGPGSKTVFHPFLDASHLHLVYATLDIITAFDLPVQGSHIYQT